MLGGCSETLLCWDGGSVVCQCWFYRGIDVRSVVSWGRLGGVG